MLKYICALALFGSSLVMAIDNLKRLDFSKATKGLPANWLDADFVARRTRQIDAQVRAYGRFTEYVRSTVSELAEQKVCLQHACEQVHNYAVVVYPTCFRTLNITTSRQARETLGDWIVWYLRSFAEENPKLRTHAEKWARELKSEAFQAWCRQPWDIRLPAKNPFTN